MTDGRTDRRTFAILESLSRLKISSKRAKIRKNYKNSQILRVIYSKLEVGAIIWPKKKTVHMKLMPICFLFSIVLVCFLCVTKQQMLVQVVCVLL